MGWSQKWTPLGLDGQIRAFRIGVVKLAVEMGLLISGNISSYIGLIPGGIIGWEIGTISASRMKGLFASKFSNFVTFAYSPSILSTKDVIIFDILVISSILPYRIIINSDEDCFTTAYFALN